MGAAVATKSSKLPSPEINITPLVDVVLVLLIIFMVIAPALADGALVELPQVIAADPKPKDLNPIQVTLAADGSCVLDDTPLSKAALKPKLEQLHAADRERALMLKTDERVAYGQVRETFAMIREIGFHGVSLKVLERKQAAK